LLLLPIVAKIRYCKVNEFIHFNKMRVSNLAAVLYNLKMPSSRNGL
jgi:hypothetical protein